MSNSLRGCSCEASPSNKALALAKQGALAERAIVTASSSSHSAISMNVFFSATAQELSRKTPANPSGGGADCDTRDTRRDTSDVDVASAPGEGDRSAAGTPGDVDLAAGEPGDDDLAAAGASAALTSASASGCSACTCSANTYVAPAATPPALPAPQPLVAPPAQPALAARRALRAFCARFRRALALEAEVSVEPLGAEVARAATPALRCAMVGVALAAARRLAMVPGAEPKRGDLAAPKAPQAALRSGLGSSGAARGARGAHACSCSLRGRRPCRPCRLPRFSRPAAPAATPGRSVEV